VNGSIESLAMLHLVVQFLTDSQSSHEVRSLASDVFNSSLVYLIIAPMLSIVLSDTLTFSGLHFLVETGEGVVLDSRQASVTESSSGMNSRIFLSWSSVGLDFEAVATVGRFLNGFKWQLDVRSVAGAVWSLVKTSELSGSIQGWPDTGRLKTFHGDNVRATSTGKTLFEGEYFVPIAQCKYPFGASRWQCFPGLWILDPVSKLGLVSGVLTQKQWRHTQDLSLKSGSEVLWTGKAAPVGIDARPIRENEVYHGETLYYEIVHEDSPGEAFRGYLDALSSYIQPSCEQSILKDGVFWDSWNDRQPHFWDVSQNLIERTEFLLKNRFPAVRSMEIDDGYAFGGFYEAEADLWTKLEHGIEGAVEHVRIRQPRRLGAGFAYEADYAQARERFPEGVKSAANWISTNGFVPGVWLGLNVSAGALLVQEHPDWFLKYSPRFGDDPELESCFGEMSPKEGVRILDISVKEVRDYLEKTADVLFKEWGFQSLKLDFWSYAFENDGFRLTNGERTAFEWREWFLAAFRARLAPSSYFCAACDISTGSPFISEWVDSVRYGIDIGNGTWRNIVTSALTGTFLLHVEAFRFYILNSDSVGLLRNLLAHQREVFYAWCLVTRSCCEVAGDLAVQPRDDLRPLQKLLLAPKNGQPAYVLGERHLLKNEPAEVVYTFGDAFSVTNDPDVLPAIIYAVFNWGDELRKVQVDFSGEAALGGGVLCDVDFFSGAIQIRNGLRWSVDLAPQSVYLGTLSPRAGDSLRIVESSWRVDILERGKTISLKLLGDSPDGFVLWSGAAHAPDIVASSVLVELERLSDNIFRIRPLLASDVLTEWEIQVSVR